MARMGRRSLLIIAVCFGSFLLLLPIVSFAQSAGTDDPSFLSPLAGPTVTMTLAANPTLSSPITVTSSPVTLTTAFSEAVVGFQIDDIAVTGGNAAGLQPQDAVTDTFTFTIDLLSDWVTVTIPASVTLGAMTDQPNQAATIAIKYLQRGAYLPIISKQPFAILGGEIALDIEANTRTRGLTTFDETTVLDFSALAFSHRPEEMRFFGDSISSSDWVTYAVTHSVSLTAPIIGVNHIDVQFSRGTRVLVQTSTLFYIPDGDFEVVDEEVFQEIWNLDSSSNDAYGIEGATEDKTLRLGITHEALDDANGRECDDAPPQSASATLTIMELPADSAYRLYVEGTVFTEDQNPNNDDTYDAFEIVIDDTVVDRYSNPDPPVTCNPFTEREIDITADTTGIPLADYSGDMVLSLQNHTRFDDYFNTYTLVDTVWIDY